MPTTAGQQPDQANLAYAVAEAGVVMLTRHLANELGPSGIRINAIAPGTIDTEILLQLSPDDVRALIERSPMKRLGTADEVANLGLSRSKTRNSVQGGTYGRKVEV